MLAFREVGLCPLLLLVEIEAKANVVRRFLQVTLQIFLYCLVFEGVAAAPDRAENKLKEPLEAVDIRLGANFVHLLVVYTFYGSGAHDCVKDR